MKSKRKTYHPALCSREKTLVTRQELLSWQWYVFLMPDNQENRFRAPDNQTARRWASEDARVAYNNEKQRQAVIAQTKMRLQEARAEANHLRRIREQEQGIQNLNEMTFWDYL